MAIIAAFEEDELDRLYTDVAVGGPRFNTGIVRSPAGTSQRTINQYDALRSFEIQYGGLSQSEKLKLEEFFMLKWGRAIGFRFYPPSDRNFLNDIVGVGFASSTTFYMKRNYRSRSRFYSRRIVKPVKDTVVITVGGYKVPIYPAGGGTPVYPAGSYPTLDNPVTVDWDTGTFTFDDAPPAGAVIRIAEGEYDIPVYFDVDEFTATDYGPFADWNSVRVVEILPAAITSAGTTPTALSLEFVTPHSGELVTEPFDVELAHVGCTQVYLFVDGIEVGGDSAAPFTFANVEPPTIDGSFEVLGLGLNDTTGDVVEASIKLLSDGSYVPDTIPPSVPTGLTAVAISSTTIRLTWEEATDPATGLLFLDDQLTFLGNRLTFNS